MLIQLQYSEEEIDTEILNRPIDQFPPAFQIWDAPYSIYPHGYSIMFIPTYPKVDNICLGKYMDLTQAAQAYSGLMDALKHNKKHYQMPREKDLPELMHKQIKSDMDLKEKYRDSNIPKATLEDIEQGRTLIAHEASFKPDIEPKIVRCIPGHSVDKQLAHDYVAYFWRTESREWVVLGGTE